MSSPAQEIGFSQIYLRAFLNHPADLLGGTLLQLKFNILGFKIHQSTTLQSYQLYYTHKIHFFNHTKRIFSEYSLFKQKYDFYQTSTQAKSSPKLPPSTLVIKVKSQLTKPVKMLKIRIQKKFCHD